MERTVIQTKIEDEIEPRSRSRSRVMSKDRSQSQIDPNQSRAMSMSISMVNSKQDKIMAQKYIQQHFGYDIYEVSDPSFCGDNQILEDVELEGNITKQ